MWQRNFVHETEVGFFEELWAELLGSNVVAYSSFYIQQVPLDVHTPAMALSHARGSLWLVF